MVALPIQPKSLESLALEERRSLMGRLDESDRVAEPSVTSVSQNDTLRPAPKRRVLVVDDDQAIVDTLNTLFTMFNYDSRTAMSGPDALVTIGVFQPDVVILDAILPVLNGFEVCRKIKTGTTTRHIRVLMMSGFLNEGNQNIVRSCGADDFMLKPFTMQELRNRVDALFTRKR